VNLYIAKLHRSQNAIWKIPQRLTEKMTGKNNEKYVGVGSYKYNNSFQKHGGGLLCHHSVITLSLLVIGLALNYNLNQRTRTIQAG
jgi:hypothetical protein